MIFLLLSMRTQLTNEPEPQVLATEAGCVPSPEGARTRVMTHVVEPNHRVKHIL